MVKKNQRLYRKIKRKIVCIYSLVLEIFIITVIVIIAVLLYQNKKESYKKEFLETNSQLLQQIKGAYFISNEQLMSLELSGQVVIFIQETYL